MGASVSKNVSKAVTRAIAKVSSNIIQNTQLSQDMSQLISVRDVHGDVHVSGNIFTQKATVNMKALLDALSTESAQQSVMQELAQEAKSVTSGLNLGQFSDAQNVMDTLLEGTMDVLSSIGQSCSAAGKMHQEIIVKRISGNVYVQDNVFGQVYDILQNCTEKAVADNRLMQDLTTKLSQKASATSEGLSGWVLVAMLAVVLGLPIGGAVIGGKALLKYIFPILLIMGVVLLILYYVRTKTEMNFVGFSTFAGSTPACLATGQYSPLQPFQDAYRASAACKDAEQCVAFDWQGLQIAQNGTYAKLDTPITKFYTSVSKECEKSIRPDAVKLLRVPNFYSGEEEPMDVSSDVGAVSSGVKPGDVYLNVKTGVWYQKSKTTNTSWEPRGVVTAKPFNKMSWGPVMPGGGVVSFGFASSPSVLDSPVENDVYAYYDGRNPEYLHVYRYDTEHGWVQDHKIHGPGLIPDTPPVINASGFKTVSRTPWLLYSGIAAALVGLLGTGYAMSASAMSASAMSASAMSASAMSASAMSASAMSAATTERYRDGYLDMKN
jgi:hypothetical protein